LQLFCTVPLTAALAVVLLISYFAYVLFAVFRVRDRKPGQRLPAALEPAAALVEQTDTQALFSQEREQAEQDIEEGEEEAAEEDGDAALHPKMAQSIALKRARKAERLQRLRAAHTARVATQAAPLESTRTIHEAQHALHEQAELGEAEAESFFERSKTLRGSLAVIILALSVAGVVAMSETFAHGAEAFISANRELGNYEFFFGLIVIPVVGGLVELYGTTGSARANRMELVMATTAGATIQMILLMVPVLVLVGVLSSRPLDLVFKPVEVIVFGATTFAFMLLSRDGESTILEGVQLVALWTLLAVTALFLPPA
jgi:Ca2+/H+ antiporter